MANKTALGNILDQVNQIKSLDAAKEVPEPSSNHKINDLTIVEIDPNNIVNWEFHDRPESELGDLENLAKEFTSIGQQQPCVVRKIAQSTEKFELIIGERRWRAALLAKMQLKVIIKDFSDEDAAIAQAIENESRVDLSDYAKGTSFSNLIRNNVIKQKDLIEKLGKSKQYISALLSFDKIPEELKKAIGDFSKINAYTAEKLKQMANKSDENLSILIDAAEQIRLGKITSNKAIDSLILKKKTTKLSDPMGNMRIFTKDGRHVFSWRKDNNGIPAIHFPKHLEQLFINGRIDIKELSNKLLEILDEKFEDLKKSGIPD